MKPEFFGPAVCGLTAAIGLDKCAKLKQNEKVLITAAAGGVGMASDEAERIAQSADHRL